MAVRWVVKVEMLVSWLSVRVVGSLSVRVVKSERAKWRGVLLLMVVEVEVVAAQPGSEKFMVAVKERSCGRFLCKACRGEW